MDYKEADGLLVGRCKNSKKLYNHTYLLRNDDNIVIRLHSTNIITFKKNGEIILDSGSWHTPTTKDRINQYLENFNIWQTDRVWYLCSQDDRYIFFDGIKIKGLKVLNPHKDNTKKQKKFNKQVNEYCKDFIEELFNNNISKPSGGDCWFCSLYEEKSGKTMGEISKDKNHIINHIKEKYYVPSLLVNAIQEYPVSMIARSVLGRIWGYNDQDFDISMFEDITKRQLLSSLKKYVYRPIS